MTIRVDWAANPAGEFVTSYQVFQSKDGGAFNMVGTVTNNFYELLNPLPGVYAFSIKAVNIAGTSIMSDVGTGPGVPSQPATPVVTVL